MIYINKGYLHLFKKLHCEYMYSVSKGVYLAFDKDNLEYIGIELFYLPHNPKEVDKQCDIKLNELLSKGILESR